MIKLASARLAQPVDGTSPSNPGGGWGNSNRAPVITSNGGGSAAAVAALENFKPLNIALRKCLELYRIDRHPDSGSARPVNPSHSSNRVSAVIVSKALTLFIKARSENPGPAGSGVNAIHCHRVPVEIAYAWDAWGWRDCNRFPRASQPAGAAELIRMRQIRNRRKGLLYTRKRLSRNCNSKSVKWIRPCNAFSATPAAALNARPTDKEAMVPLPKNWVTAKITLTWDRYTLNLRQSEKPVAIG